MYQCHIPRGPLSFAASAKCKPTSLQSSSIYPHIYLASNQSQGSEPVPNYRTQPHNSNVILTTLQEDDWASPVDGRRKGRQGRKQGSPSLNVLFTTPLHHLFLGDPPPRVSRCLDCGSQPLLFASRSPMIYLLMSLARAARSFFPGYCLPHTFNGLLLALRHFAPVFSSLETQLRV